MKKDEFYREISKIARNNGNKLKFEQYETDIDTAYEFMSFIELETGIKGKVIADLGCGNGLLGISAALFGAEKVDMYDIDKSLIEIAKRNIYTLELKNVHSAEKDMFDISMHYNIAVSNPPFGFQSNFSVPAFIKKALSISDNLFFLYKDNLNIRKLAELNGMSILPLNGIKIRKSKNFHKKDYYTLPVVLVYKVVK